MKNYPLLCCISVFVLFFIFTPSLVFSDVSVEDGFLKKYTSDGKYLIETKWSPAGEIKPDIDYFFVFQVKDALTDTLLQNNSFNLEITQNGQSINDFVKEFDSSIFSKKLVFKDSGTISFILSDINNSDQSTKFSLKLDSGQSSLVNDGVFTSKRKVGGSPVIFACGFEKKCNNSSEML